MGTLYPMRLWIYRLRRRLSAAVRRLSSSQRGKRARRFASHLPVLIATGRLLPVHNVVELGSGRYSTALFLDASTYPHLQRLASLEDDARWATAMRRRHGRDGRWELEVVADWPSAIERHLDALGALLSGYAPPAREGEIGLVFVDNSSSVALRALALRQVSRHLPSNAILIAHDLDRAEYQEALSPELEGFVISELSPPTGVYWRPGFALAGKAMRVGRSVREGATTLDPMDASGWRSRLAIAETGPNDQEQTCEFL